MTPILFVAIAVLPVQDARPAAPVRSASESAAAFTLDSLDTDADAPSDTATSAADTTTTAPIAVEPAPPEPVAAAPAAPRPADAAAAATAMSWLDIPIASLIANPRTRAVLDRDLPGLSQDENLAKFAGLSLHKFQPLTGGQLTDAMLAKVEADMKAPPPGAAKRTER